MPVDNEQIKKALDHFENDEFVDAKEILQKEIRKSKNDHLKDKLELKQEIEPIEKEEVQDKEDQEKEE